MKKSIINNIGRHVLARVGVRGNITNRQIKIVKIYDDDTVKITWDAGGECGVGRFHHSWINLVTRMPIHIIYNQLLDQKPTFNLGESCIIRNYRAPTH